MGQQGHTSQSSACCHNHLEHWEESGPGPGVLEHLYQVFGLDVVHGGQPLLGFAFKNEKSIPCSIGVLPYTLTLCLQLTLPHLDRLNEEARVGLRDAGL